MNLEVRQPYQLKLYLHPPQVRSELHQKDRDQVLKASPRLMLPTTVLWAQVLKRLSLYQEELFGWLFWQLADLQQS